MTDDMAEAEPLHGRVPEDSGDQIADRNIGMPPPTILHKAPEPLSPVDRSSAEALQREADRLNRKIEPEIEERPSYVPQEPAIEHVEKKPSWKTRVGLASAAALGLAGAAFGVSRMNNSDNEDRPAVVVPLETPTPRPTETSSPTEAVPTNTPTEEPTQIPETPTPSHEAAPSHGQYKSIEEMPISESKKEAIKELTKDSIPFIITDKGMVVIQHNMINRPDKIQYYNEELSVSQLHEIGLNVADFPNAQELFDRAIDMAKYEAWKNQSGNESVSFEDYLNNKNNENYTFEVWGYNGTSDQLSFHTLDDDAFVIIKYLAGIDRTNIISSHAAEKSNEVIGNVVSVGLFSVNPSGLGGYTNANGVPLENYRSAAEIASTLATLGADVRKTVVSGKFSLAGQTVGGKLEGSIGRITQVLIPDSINTQTPLPRGSAGGIFSVEGSPYKR